MYINNQGPHKYRPVLIQAKQIEKIKKKSGLSLIQLVSDATGGKGIGQRSDSWTNVKKKITPSARFSVGKIQRTENWIVEERLKSNFYLDDGKTNVVIIFTCVVHMSVRPLNRNTLQP